MKTKIFTAFACALILVIAPAMRAHAATLVVNLSNLLPAGQGTGDAYIDTNTGETATRSGHTYAVWSESPGASSSGSDLYLYDKTTNTVNNLSSMLSGSNNVGDSMMGSVKVFADGSPLVAWWEADNSGQYELYIYNGKDNSVIATESLMAGAWVANYGTTTPLVGIASDDSYYVAFTHEGTRGLSDAFIYKSTSNQVVHISGSYTAGQGTQTAIINAGMFAVDGTNNANLAIVESRSATENDTYLYNSAADTVVNLSELRSVGANGAADNQMLRVDSNNKVYVAWYEHDTVADKNAVYLYNGNTSTVTDVSALYLAGGYDRVTFNDTYWFSVGFEISLSNKPYIAWSWESESTAKKDIFMYDGDANTTINISSKLASGQAAEDGNYASVGFSAAGTAIVSFMETSTTSDYGEYVYNHATDTITTLANSPNDYVYNTNRIIQRPSANPYVLWNSYNASNDLQLYLYNFDTSTTTNITDLAGGVGQGDFTNQLYNFALIDNKPILLVSIDVGGQEDLYLYNDNDAAMSNLTDLLSPTEGSGQTGYSALAVDSSTDTIYAAWNESTGLRGGNDFYIYSQEPENNQGGNGGNIGNNGVGQNDPSLNNTANPGASGMLANTGASPFGWIAAGALSVLFGTVFYFRRHSISE